jgi:hypothetical protein
VPGIPESVVFPRQAFDDNTGGVDVLTARLFGSGMVMILAVVWERSQRSWTYYVLV